MIYDPQTEDRRSESGKCEQVKDQRKPREFWIDPIPCDDEMPNCFDAFSQPVMQGPPQWIYSLIHVRSLNSQGIDEETVRRVCEFLKSDEAISTENSLVHTSCKFWAAKIERKFLGVKE